MSFEVNFIRMNRFTIVMIYIMIMQFVVVTFTDSVSQYCITFRMLKLSSWFQPAAGPHEKSSGFCTSMVLASFIHLCHLCPHTFMKVITSNQVHCPAT